MSNTTEAEGFDPDRLKDAFLATRLFGWNRIYWSEMKGSIIGEALGGRDWEPFGYEGNSPMAGLVPFYHSNVKDDYSVLNHARDNWPFSKRRLFWEELREVISSRFGKSCIYGNICYPDILTFYKPGDYSRAAVTILERWEGSDHDATASN